MPLFIVRLVREGKARRGATRCRILRRDELDFLATQIFVDGRKGSKLPMGTETPFLPAVTTRAILRSRPRRVLAKRPAERRPVPTERTKKKCQNEGMVQKRVTAQGWLGSTPEGQRPQIRGLRAGGSLAVASSIPATQLSSPARLAERVVTPHAPMTLGANHVSRAPERG